MKAEKLAEDNEKASAQEQAEKDAQFRAKKREVDAMKLKAIKLWRKELELEEKALRASLEETKALEAIGSGREKRVQDEEDKSTDSDSHYRKMRTKVVLTSDFDGKKGNIPK